MARGQKTPRKEEERNGLSGPITNSTLTDPKLFLLTVLLQVNLDAGFKEIQLGLELLRHRGHGILHLGQAAVVPEQIHPAGTPRNRTVGCLWPPSASSRTRANPAQTRRQAPAVTGITATRAATYNRNDNLLALGNG